MKIIIATFIGLGMLLPAVAFAKSADHTPPSILSLHIASSNANPAIAAPGDTVTISFVASEKIQPPILLVNARPALVRGTNTSGNSWAASYIVTSNDAAGKVLYIAALADISNNIYVCSNLKLPLIKYCPPTDGSSVTIIHSSPPPDTTPPVITASSNITAEATSSLGAYVSYSPPTATDAVSGSVAVSCTSTSGSLFALGATTVVCSAADAAGNKATSSFTVDVVDTTPPAIAAHADISQVATTTRSVAAAVTYTAPTATDAVSGSVAVSCTPISGSLFVLGTTTINCSASDAAGNTATSNFAVGVYLPPAPAGPTYFTFAPSQTDQSFLCDNTTTFFAGCFAGGNTQTYNLGGGSSLQGGALYSVTIALDPTYASYVPGHPWSVTIKCFQDLGHTNACTDWVVANPFWNLDPSFIVEQATTTTDNIHWTAYFTDPTHEANFNTTSPVTFNPAYYYQITLYDNGIPIPAYGSQSLAKPYFILTGVTQ